MLKNMMGWLQEKLVPLAQKFSQQRHFNAITSGLMYTMPLTIMGAIATVIATPPVTEEMINAGGFASIFSGWFYFVQNHYNEIMAINDMSMGIFAFAAVGGIAYSLAKHYKLQEFSCSITATVIFLLVSAQSVPAVLSELLVENANLTDLIGSAVKMIPTTFLDAKGLFSGMFIALGSVEITRLCRDKKFMIRMPSSVPSMVSESMSSIVPTLVNLLVFYGLNLCALYMFEANLPQVILNLLTPAIDGLNSPIPVIIITTLCMLLWCFGVHPAAILQTLFFPLYISAILHNMELVQAGQNAQIVYSGLWGFAMIGGSGCTLGLAFLCARSKSKQLNALGKISIVPGLCGINEPLIFGVPVTFNPIMMIPFVGGAFISMLLGWGAYEIGFLRPENVLILTMMPMGVGEFISSQSITNFIFPFLLIFVQMIIWYPFFKIQEQKYVAQEQEIDMKEGEVNALS